jgi:hypothetical protein
MGMLAQILEQAKGLSLEERLRLIAEQAKRLSVPERLRLISELEGSLGELAGSLGLEEAEEPEPVPASPAPAAAAPAPAPPPQWLAAMDAFLALGGTAHSDDADVSGDKYRHLAEIYADRHE